MKPFSKLKREIEKLFVPELQMEFCCSSFPIRGQRPSNNAIPRFYVRQNKKVIWDFPKDFEFKEMHYAYWARGNKISELARDYIDTPIGSLLEKKFANDFYNFSVFNYEMLTQVSKHSGKYHLTELFIAADRRLGKDKLLLWAETIDNKIVNEILIARFKLTEIHNSKSTTNP